MGLEYVSVRGANMAITEVGSRHPNFVHFVWGHGWGQSAVVLLPLAESLSNFGFSSLIDFPGFGRSPLPPAAWGTADYADAVADWLSTLPKERRIWVGHSFGCRVGIQLSSRHPGMLNGMVLVAAAGLPRHRSPMERGRIWLRQRSFKMAKCFVSEGPRLEQIRSRLGSSDYYAAGKLRPILTRVVNENLATVARTVDCPTLLVYGELDKDTPKEIGERLSRIVPKAELIVLDGFDHHSILVEGRHQLTRQILRFAEGISK
jgi:pimeloyl-ACP methyl ester carboxylesterase